MSDQFLLSQFQEGTADAATLLYFKYARRLQALAATKLGDDLGQRVDAEDVVQSVFRTFFRRAALGEFEVPEGGDLWKLLLVITLNKVRSLATHHRAALRDVARTQGELPPHAAPADPADDFAVTTLQITIDEVLNSLPAGTRPIVEMRIEGYEVAEIAERLSRSKRSVERILREFRDQLYKTLGAV